jgi:hypothetical protein
MAGVQLCAGFAGLGRINRMIDELIISEEWEQADLSLLETLDHVLNRGLVIAGEITISVADIDLIFVGLNVLVSSVETANEVLRKRVTE